MPMDRRVDSTRDDEHTEHLGRRDRERSRRMTAGTAGPTAASRHHAEENEFERLKAEVSEKIERECAHVDAVLSEKIDGVRELLDQRISDQTRLLQAEFQRIEASLAHETAALRTEIGGLKNRIEGVEDRIEGKLAHETGALRAEIGSVKELLLSRMEQQERVRAAEYAATKWSIRSMMAAMALLVAMMARFTLFQ